MSSAPGGYGDCQTRRRILEAAWKLLEERGVGVGLADVAARAGVSRQAVYLHFGDRAGLLVALGDYIDASFGRDRLREYVFGAPSGRESLRRWVETMSWYTAKIEPINRIVEAGQGEDEALDAMWRDRFTGRREHVRRIAERLATDGQLAAGWTVEDAGDLIYTVTLPGPWRVLTSVLGWSQERYAEDIARLLEQSLVAGERVSPTADRAAT